MTDGDAKFYKALSKAERLAEKYEMILPHVSDTIYSLVKLVRSYDKNIKGLLKINCAQQKTINRYDKSLKFVMSTYLNGKELKEFEKFLEELE